MQNLSLAFIHNVERSIKITDHFTCTSANVIYCITCTYYNKLYIGETSLDTLIFLIILNSIWQFAAFPYISAVRKAVKH